MIKAMRASCITAIGNEQGDILWECILLEEGLIKKP